jgi:PPOX class probable F420-dependent enzyme
MPVQLTSEQSRLLEGPNYGQLATIMPDGSPQITTVWVDYDGTHVLVNTAEGRQKPRNINRDPRVALEVLAIDDPYDLIRIRGRVVEVTREGAWEHINKLSHKYRGSDYPKREGEQRIIFKIEPEHVYSRGPVRS